MALRPGLKLSACVVFKYEDRKWDAHFGSLAHRSCSCSSTVGCCSRRKILARRLARSLRLFGATVGVESGLVCACSGCGSAGGGGGVGAVAGAPGSPGGGDDEAIGGDAVEGTRSSFIFLISTAAGPVGGCVTSLPYWPILNSCQIAGGNLPYAQGPR